MRGFKLTLTRRIFLSLGILLTITFILTISVGEKILGDVLFKNTQDSVSLITEVEGNKIDEFFRERELLGLRSVKFIKETLQEDVTPEQMVSFDDKYKVSRGALRVDTDAFPDDDISGVFLSNLSPLTDQIKRTILLTEKKFDDYAKGVVGTVFNMYLITKRQLIRIYEKDWALQIGSDHDFTKDVFYYVADPENDPERLPVWTPVYYDSIWKRWMTSLILPLYEDGNFFGVIGHDVILDDVYKRIISRRIFKDGYSFVFDAQGDIVVHPWYQDRLIAKAKMGEYLSFKDIHQAGLKDAMKKALNSASLVSIRFTDEGEDYYLTAYKLRTLDWYFGTVVSYDEMMKFMPSLRRKFIMIVSCVQLLIMALLYWLIWNYIRRPVKELSKATKELSRGNLEHRVVYRSRDELGELADSFDNMAHKLQNELKHRRNMEREVMKAHKEMETFLYTVSHDLKSPLFAIKGFAEMLQAEIGDQISGKRKHFFTRIRVNVEKMNHLIEDLLTLARIGRVNVEKKKLSLNDVFKATKYNNQNICRQKGIIFKVNGGDCTVFAGEQHIKRILDNLVDNAIKYMGDEKNGNVLELIAMDMGNNLTRIAVKDTGPGIAIKHQDKIFEPFFRVNASEEEAEGTGIGLASVKKIVELYGGKLWVVSGIGEGTEIWIEMVSDDSERP